MLKIEPYLHTIYRQNCILCGTNTPSQLCLCPQCLEDLPYANDQRCHQCGLPSPEALCGNCLNHPPHFDHTHALFSYHYPITGLIQHYKYHQTLHLSHTFAQLLIRQIDHYDIDAIIPMPLHPLRLSERGFNQSLEIAKHIATTLHIPIDTACCSKIKNTPPQASLTLKARSKNMKGAFASHTNLAGKRLALIDDVMTTGASLNELAKTLKQAGAANISCYVLARTE